MTIEESRKKWRRIANLMACLVVFVTVYALILPASTMTKEERVLNCLAEVHTHTGECFDEKGTLICGKEDYVVHLHEADCFSEDGNLVCSLPQILAHQHTDACYEEIITYTCGSEQEHVHGEACYHLVNELICGKEEHVHGEECCDEETDELICEQEEHVHSEECYETVRELICELEEHKHSEECTTVERILICGQEEIVLHTHSEDCFDVDGNCVCGMTEIKEHQHGEACFETVSIKDLETDSEEEIPEEGYQQYVETVVIEETVDTEETVEAEETTDVEEITDEEETTEPFNAEDKDSETTETKEAEEETVPTETEANQTETEETEVKIGEVVTRVFTGRDFAVTVQTSADAQIPINSVLKVNEILPGTEEYAQYYQQASSSVTTDQQQVVFARFFDICFMLDGAEIEPQAPVDVIIAYQNRVNVPEGEAAVVHFDGSGTAQNVDLEDPGASAAADEAFMQACYSEDNAFAFEADSFSVWGTTVVRTYQSGKVSALCAQRKITSQLNGKQITYQITITPDDFNDSYEISTSSNAIEGEAIPVDGANGSDGISLYSPELIVKKNGVVQENAELSGKLYCRQNDTYTQVAYLKIENSVLVPYDDDDDKIEGTLYYVHDVDKVKVEWGVKYISVVIDAEQLNSGTSKQDSIIWFDVIGDNGTDGYVKDAYKVEFLGYPGDVFRLSDYFVGDEFYFRRWCKASVNKNETGYTENPAVNDSNTSHGLVSCDFVKIVENNGVYEMRPCWEDGTPVGEEDVTLYVITDNMYQFSFAVNNMVKEHGEDDGQAYFWAGTDYYLGTTSPNNRGTVVSLDSNQHWYNNKAYNFYRSVNDTVIRQDTYYIIGRIGESMLPAEASKTAINPDQEVTEPMTAILYAATGTETTAVNAKTWDSTWKGTHDYNKVGTESYPGWHTEWMDMGGHASDTNGWRGYDYWIRDYLVLDSSWDKVMNFVVTEEDGKVILNAQKFDDPTLYPFETTTTTTRKPSSGKRQNNGNDIAGYGSGSTAIQLVYAREGIITQEWYKAGFAATASGNLPSYSKMDHVQLRVNTNVVIDINGLKYQGSFLYVSGAVSPFGRASSTDKWTYLVSNTNLTRWNLENARQSSDYWVSLGIANSQESKSQSLRTNVLPQGFEYMWDEDLINIAIKYELAGVLKPINDDGTVNTDPNTWIVYSSDAFNPNAYGTDDVATRVKSDIATATAAEGSVKEGLFEYSIVLDGEQLKQSTYACPRTAGYDVILDVNAAFRDVFSSQPKVVVTKQWDDVGYESYRPDSIFVTVERHNTSSNVWEEFKEIEITGIANDFNWVASYTISPSEHPEDYDRYRIKEGSERMVWKDGRDSDVHCPYTVTYDGLYVSNTAVNPYVAVEGYKIWQTSRGEAMDTADIPESITLNLYQSEVAGTLGVLYDSRIVTKDSQDGNGNSWYWTFGNLEKYYVGDDGKLYEYTYTIAEVKATDTGGYEVLHEYSGSLVGGQMVDGNLVTIGLEEIVEGDGSVFVFTNQRYPVMMFRKTDPEGIPLQGAQFTLIAENDSGFTPMTFVSDANGYLTTETDEGTIRSVEMKQNQIYILTETKAPPGYVKLTTSIRIQYDSSLKKWVCSYVDEDENEQFLQVSESKDGDLLTITVLNKGLTLPETGGVGTKKMYLAGSVLTLSSLILLGWIWVRKRRCESP